MGYRNFAGNGCPALCFKCSFDLRQTNTVPAPQYEVKRQKQWLQAIKTGEITITNGEAVPSSEYFDVLHHLARLCVSTYPFARDIGVHAAAALGIDWVKPSRTVFNASIEGLGIAERAALMQISGWLLDKWPQRLVGHCTEHEIWSSALTKDFDNPPAWYMTIVQKHLKRSIWKGKPDPGSKRAGNWKSIHKVLAMDQTPDLKAHSNQSQHREGRVGNCPFRKFPPYSGFVSRLR
jgi:hypothetical protein